MNIVSDRSAVQAIQSLGFWQNRIFELEENNKLINILFTNWATDDGLMISGSSCLPRLFRQTETSPLVIKHGVGLIDVVVIVWSSTVVTGVKSGEKTLIWVWDKETATVRKTKRLDNLQDKVILTLRLQLVGNCLVKWSQLWWTTDLFIPKEPNVLHSRWFYISTKNLSLTAEN